MRIVSLLLVLSPLVVVGCKGEPSPAPSTEPPQAEKNDGEPKVDHAKELEIERAKQAAYTFQDKVHMVIGAFTLTAGDVELKVDEVGQVFIGGEKKAQLRAHGQVLDADDKEIMGLHSDGTLVFLAGSEVQGAVTIDDEGTVKKDGELWIHFPEGETRLVVMGGGPVYEYKGSPGTHEAAALASLLLML